MGKNKNEAPSWTTNMRKYIINQLAIWQPYKSIWATVTTEQFTKDTGIECLDPAVHGYNSFRMRCQRIKKHDIAIAHEDYQREMGAARWADDAARVQGLSDLIDKVNKIIDDEKFSANSTGTLSSLVGQMQKLYEQIRKEVSADADRAALSASGARVLLSNPKSVQIDAEYVSELLLVYREEIGGLHNLDLASLNTTELELLRDKCQEIIVDRGRKIHDVDYEVVDEGDDEETNR